MGRSSESCVAQDVISVAIDLEKIGIMINHPESFGIDDPRYQAATHPCFNDHRIRNVLESFLPADDIPKGIENLKEIRCRYFAAQEQRQHEPKHEQTHKKHKNKHHH